MRIISMLIFCLITQYVQANTIIEHQIYSSFLNEERSLKVELPESYNQSDTKKFAVLYVLDGQNHHQNTKYISDFLAEKKHIPELIIVSIPHTGKRSRDYYTYIEKTGEQNKGADNFLSFLENEVIELVKNTYRVNSHRILAGHSASGVFVIHSLIKRPQLFQSRFSLSPGLHHNKQLINDTKTFLRNQTELNSFIYLNLGGNEFYKSQNALNEINQAFKDYAPKGLRYHFEFPKDEGHRTTPFIGMYLGLKRLYAPLTISFESNSQEDFINHFNSVSNEFAIEVKPEMDFLMGYFNYYMGYENNLNRAIKVLNIATHFYPESTSTKGTLQLLKLYVKSGTKEIINYFSKHADNKPEEQLLNKIGYGFLEFANYTDAVEVFKLAVLLYPKSANAHDSLGDGYSQKGDMVKAKESYQSAVALARKSNHPQLELYLSKLEDN